MAADEGMQNADSRHRFSATSLSILSSQVALVACALILSVWVKLSWMGLLGIGVCGSSSILGAIVSRDQNQSTFKAILFFTIAGGLAVLASQFVPFGHPRTLGSYHSTIAWLMAAVVFAPALRRDRDSTKWWKRIALVWGLLGSAIWLVASYDENLPVSFYAGLVLSIVLLALSKFLFQMHFIFVQVVNTLILVLAFLPLTELALRLSHRVDTQPETGKRYYSYEVAKKKPAAFATWWKYYNQQWEFMVRSNFMRDPSGQFPFRLRPNSKGRLFQSSICINNKGFRGKDISDEKGEVFRIVALGESTTFGCTLNADDKPWPEVLEQLVRARLKLSRPVEVINAGVPGYTLVHNLLRLERDILPLKPDIIISYHGYNGFDLLSNSSVQKDPPLPPYRQRPLKLLADFEQGLKIRAYKRRMTAMQEKTASIPDPMQSPYATTYRQLIAIARTNGIALVVGNFSMAANLQSESGVLDFYRAGYPLAAARVRANAAHSGMVSQLVKENPEIYFVDTHPSLDGYNEKFIDLVHFTQEGRQQLAETFFAGITNILIERVAAAATNHVSTRAE
jgi:lysophospholipase L1-like esterase